MSPTLLIGYIIDNDIICYYSVHGQWCQRHVVGQQVISDISVSHRWSICSLCSESNNANLLLCPLTGVLGTSILFHISNTTWPTTWRRVWWPWIPNLVTAADLFFSICSLSILHHHPALLHRHTLILDRLLTFLVAFAIFINFRFLSLSVHSHLSLFQADLLELWPLVIWQSLATVVLVSVAD